MKRGIIEKISEMASSSLKSIFHANGKIYTFLNPVSYSIAQKHLPLFMQFDGIFADGNLLVRAIKLLYGIKVHRRSFDMTSMGAYLFSYASETKKSIYIVSSEQIQIETAITKIKDRFPDIVISGYRNGFFADEIEEDEAIRIIIEQQPDYLIVGMGVIKQEMFLLKTKEAGFQGIGFTCGGFIHQIAENSLDYYPDWVDDMNVRFLYRIVKEPHTRKRYLKALFLFPYYMIKERLVG